VLIKKYYFKIRGEAMGISPVPKKGMTHEEKSKLVGEAYTSGYKFATKVFEAFPGIVKSIVLFGSAQKKSMGPKSDIDILIIIDDTTITPNRKFIDWYNLELANIIRKHDPRLHVTTVTLTTFWENVRIGEPIVINVLRYGIPLIDTGYFEPLQFLLQKGRIRPSEEAIYNALTRAPWHLNRATARILGAIVDFYWVMVDSSHAALMAHGKVPPSPEHIESMLINTFVNTKMLPHKYVDYYREVWKTAKAVIHGEVVRLSGSDYDQFRVMTEDFEKQMKSLVENRKI
jgi:predicted nucleotidyltransferase